MKLLRTALAVLTGELGRLQHLTSVQATLIKHYQQREVDLHERAEKAEAANSQCDECHVLRSRVEGLEVMLDNAEAALLKAGFTQNKEHGEWTPPAPKTACKHQYHTVEKIGSSGLMEDVVECKACGKGVEVEGKADQVIRNPLPKPEPPKNQEIHVGLFNHRWKP